MLRTISGSPAPGRPKPGTPPWGAGAAGALRASAGRIVAVLLKEVIQLRRDRLTFAMLVGVPILQLVLFGYAINGDPRLLPTAVVAMDDGPLVRAVVRAAENTGYFRVVAHTTDAEAEALVAKGQVQFALVFPADFSRRVLRGEKPAMAVYADASDPAATGPAAAALAALPAVALVHELQGPLAALRGASAPFELRLHRRYNPEGLTAYNVVPGLMGVILTMTLVMLTAMAMTRERERGTLENLLATPVQPLEMMVGKILPYVIFGYLQVLLIFGASRLLFGVPMHGSFVLLTAMVLLFITATLAVGYTFSTIARSQMQSMQMTIFYFLPNILLSGFMFPFRGMPGWAQAIGELLPLTHFLRIVRAVMLKGAELPAIATEVGWLFGFVLLFSAFALLRFRRTLD